MKTVLAMYIKGVMLTCPAKEMPFEVVYSLAVAQIEVESQFKNVRNNKDHGYFQFNEINHEWLGLNNPYSLTESTCAFTRFFDYKMRRIKSIARTLPVKVSNRDLIMVYLKAYNAGNDFISYRTLIKAFYGIRSTHNGMNRIKYLSGQTTLDPTSHNIYAAVILNAFGLLKKGEYPIENWHRPNHVRRIKHKMEVHKKEICKLVDCKKGLK